MKCVDMPYSAPPFSSVRFELQRGLASTAVHSNYASLDAALIRKAMQQHRSYIVYCGYMLALLIYVE